MTVARWWERWPERLDWEQDELRRAGIPHRVHEPDERGVVRIDLDVEIDGEVYALTARFPDLYPWFRPMVSAPPGFRFHQHPFGHELCLLARDPALWETDMSLAWLIATQLPKIVRANASDDEAAAAIEEHVPEPVVEAYSYVHTDVVLVDSAWEISDDTAGGTLDIALSRPELPLRGALMAVRDGDGTVVATAEPALAAAFGAGCLSGRWVRVAEPVMAQRAEDFLVAIGEVAGDLLKPQWQRGGTADVDVIGVVATDEIRYADVGDAWVFLLRIRRRQQQQHQGRTTPSATMEAFLVRAMRAGRSDLGQRTPWRGHLATTRVAVAGLGALGAPCAVELARAGVGELAMLDHDLVEAGTVSRWPLGLTAAGVPKVIALYQFLAVNYPYTAIRQPLGWRLGSVAQDDYSDASVLDRFLSDVDLVLDATANIAVHHALADLAWQRGLPYVQVTATAGAWGGLVVALRHGETACWSCALAHVGPTIAKAPADPGGFITTIGCSDITFTGAGFDLAPLVAEAVRLVCARLSEGTEAGYPAVSWDAETLALRDPEGRSQPPTWTTAVLPPTPGCESCGQ